MKGWKSLKDCVLWEDGSPMYVDGSGEEGVGEAHARAYSSSVPRIVLRGRGPAKTRL